MVGSMVHVFRIIMVKEFEFSPFVYKLLKTCLLIEYSVICTVFTYSR